MMGLDEHDIITSLESDLVHSYNKEMLLEKEAHLPSLKGNVVLLGDLIQDIKIMHHVSAPNILTLGCFNTRLDLMSEGPERDAKTALLKDYCSNYDIVFTGEANLDHLGFLLQTIHEGGVAPTSLEEYEKLPGSSVFLDLLS